MKTLENVLYEEWLKSWSIFGLEKKNSKIIAVVKDLKGCAEEVLGLFHKLEQAEPGLVGGCIRFVPSH